MNKQQIKGKPAPAKGPVKRTWAKIGGSRLTRAKGANDLAGDTTLVLEISGDSLVKAKGPDSLAGDTTVLEITSNSQAKARESADKPIGSVQKKVGGAQKAPNKSLDKASPRSKSKQGKELS